MSSRCRLQPWLLSQTLEADMDCYCCYHCHKVPVSKCRSLPTPLQKTMKPATAKGPMILTNSLRKVHGMPCAIANFLLVSATAGITHMSQMGCHISPTLGLSEYALIICCFHPLSPGQETDTKVWWGQNQSWTSRSGTTKEEEWKPLLQLQELWIKSPQSDW